MVSRVLTAITLAAVICVPANADLLNENCKFEMQNQLPGLIAKDNAPVSTEIEPVEAWQKGLMTTEAGAKLSLDAVLDMSIACQERNAPGIDVVQTTAKEKVDQALAPYQPESGKDFIKQYIKQ